MPVEGVAIVVTHHIGTCQWVGHQIETRFFHYRGEEIYQRAPCIDLAHDGVAHLVGANSVIHGFTQL